MIFKHLADFYYPNASAAAEYVNEAKWQQLSRFHSGKGYWKGGLSESKRKSHDTQALFYKWFFLNPTVQYSGKRRLIEPDKSRFLVEIKLKYSQGWSSFANELTWWWKYLLYVHKIQGKRADFWKTGQYEKGIDCSLKKWKNDLFVGSIVAAAWLVEGQTDGCTSTCRLK